MFLDYPGLNDTHTVSDILISYKIFLKKRFRSVLMKLLYLYIFLVFDQKKSKIFPGQTFNIANLIYYLIRADFIVSPIPEWKYDIPLYQLMKFELNLFPPIRILEWSHPLIRRIIISI